MTVLRIHGSTVDLEPGVPAPESGAASSFLLAARGPLGPQKRRELAACNVHVEEHVGEGTYLCYCPRGNVEEVERLDLVENLYPYPARLKVTHEPASEEEAAPEAAVTPHRGEEEERIDAEVGFHPEVDARAAAERVAVAAGPDAEVEVVGRHKLDLRIAPFRLEAVAALPEVAIVERRYPLQPAANVAGELVGAVAAHQDLGLRGEGEVIALCDSGLDRGRMTDIHPHFVGRIARLIPLGRSSVSNDPDGHGTHCAGLIVGRGTSPAAPGVITGMAPDALLVVQSTFGRGKLFEGVPRDLADLFEPPYERDGARVHSNSWIESRPGNQYSLYAREVDAFVFAHRDLIVVFAAGNEGRAEGGSLADGTVRPPGVAKNCITVGASESRRPQGGRPWSSLGRLAGGIRGEPFASDGYADRPEGVAPLSGRGPTSDGRVKPDLVAPGTAVLSARSRQVRDGRLSATWGASADNNYVYNGGTSMAAAIVAGCAAVARQHLRRELGRSPSAALVKALLIHSARDIEGQFTPSEAPQTPNFSEGWGRVDLEAAVRVAPPRARRHLDIDAGLETGEEMRWRLDCREGGHPMAATLVWTDPPGATLQNDLDLVVHTAGGEERHGNMPPGSSGFDRVNNVERASWDSFPAGPFEVVVKAARMTLENAGFALIVEAAL